MIRPPEPEDLQGFGRAVVALLESLGIPYAIGGSVAAMEYGEPRLTIDIDLMIDAGRDQLESFVTAIGDWQLYVTPIDVIVETDVPHGLPFNVIDGLTGTRADIYVVAGGEGLSGSAMRRRQQRVWDLATGARAWFLAPEDVILFKLLYYRRGGQVADKHPRDIAKMVAIVGPQLDGAYLERWARELEVLDIWRALSEPGAPAPADQAQP